MKGAIKAVKLSVVKKLRSGAEDLMRDRKMVTKFLVIVLILLSAVALRVHEAGKADITVDAADESVAVKRIYVDVGGAVKNPGVYEIESSTRLFEVIEMAGGLKSNADTDSINQASFVEDGEKIIIPSHRKSVELEGQSEEAAGEPDTGAETESDSGTESGTESGTDVTSGVNSSGLVNINAATKEELMTLNGIGEVMAERIIEYRTGNRFKSIEDIKSVKGIGDATFSKIKESITV